MIFFSFSLFSSLISGEISYSPRIVSKIFLLLIRKRFFDNSIFMISILYSSSLDIFNLLFSNFDNNS